MSPADLPWWGWLLSGAVSAVIGAAIMAGTDDDVFGTVLAWVFIFFGGLLGFVGLIRFVKWVWTG